MSEDNNSGNSHQIDLSEQGKTRQISMLSILRTKKATCKSFYLGDRRTWDPPRLEKAGKFGQYTDVQRRGCVF